MGPALLLVHGGMTTAVRWEPLWELLTRRFRVTAMDRRGRGSSGDAPEHSLRSEYDDVIAVARHLAHEQGHPIDVFGHSYGAVCALGAAAHGGPFRRVALYEPPGPATVPPEWVARMKSLIEADQSGRAMVSFLTEIIGLSREGVMALRDSPIARDSTEIVAATMAREADALSTVDLAELACAVRQPVLLLLGEKSPPWASTITSSLRQVLPDPHLVLLPRQGHEAVDAAPETVAAELTAFLADD
jgi:pimeloyl-ACP methyl ester carboxylesterase